MMALAVLAGCSSSPVTPDKDIGILNNEPAIVLSATGNTNTIGLLGAYELNINTETMTADLVTKRMGTAIGDSFVISGMPFFTMVPCNDCLKMTTIQLTPGGDLALTFELKHPFEPGNISLPPKANNRLDLDIFDVAAVISPINETATQYTLLGKTYDGICVNADGYTKELSKLFTPEDTAAMPFFLVKDDATDATPPVSTYNEFAMGGSDEFDVVFNLVAGAPTLKFNMFLTFGYGAAAKGSDKPTFLNPKYYNPEFNRKNAWKVTVTPPTESWKDNEPLVEKNVEVKVWDWQQGAIVSTTTPYSDETVTTKVYEASNVTKVEAEVFGDTGEALVATSGLGTPSSPLIYNVPIANSLSRPAGNYTGIVKVTDSRTPALAFTEGQDFLIDTPDGMTLNNVLMTEFATYQIFTATIVIGCGPIDGSGAFITTTCPQTITEGDSIAFVVGGVVSPGETITYYADFNWDGIPANFDEDASSATGTFSPHVFNTVGIFTVGFKAKDSCTPQNVYFFTETCQVTVEEIPPTIVWFENFDALPANWWSQNYAYPSGGGCANIAPTIYSTTAPFGPSGSGNIRFGYFPNPANGGNVSTVVTVPVAVPVGYTEVILRVYLASDFSDSRADFGGMNFKIAASAVPGLAPFSSTGAVGTTTVLTSTNAYGSTFPAIGMCGASSQMAGQIGWDASGQSDLPPILTQYVDLVIPPTFHGQTVKVCFQWSPDACNWMFGNPGFALDDYTLYGYP